MDIIEFYRSKANSYFNVSMYLLVLAIFVIVYSLMTSIEFVIMLAISFLVVLSSIFFFMYQIYQRKTVGDKDLIKNYNKNIFYINFQSSRLVHFNLFDENGKKIFEVKDTVPNFLYLLVPKYLVANRWQKVALNQSILFFIHVKKGEVRFELEGKEFIVKKNKTNFLINEELYRITTKPLLFDFTVEKDNNTLLVAQKGQMKVSVANNFRNPNIASVEFNEQLSMDERVKLIAILLLKWCT